MSTTYDTIILGSSPNALTAAAYLARTGQRVLVIEPSEHLGGPASTFEFASGFKADQGLMSGRLDPEVVKDLNLEEHGLELIERKTITSLLPGGRSFTLPADRKAACEVIRGFSQSDAGRYEKFMQLMDLASNLLKNAYRSRPAEHPASADDAKKLNALVEQLRGYGRREMTEVIRVLVISARDLLEEWFESEELQGLLATAAVRGLYSGPFAAATTFNLLHHLTIGDGYFRATARGGIGAISKALAASAAASGAEVRTGAGSVRVLVSDGVATSVEVDGEQFVAAKIISDYDARHTFRSLVPPPELTPEFNRAINKIRYNGTVARINLALKELPKFTGVSEDALRGTVVLAPSLKYIEQAFDQAKYGGVSEHPYLELTIPSLTDATLAPPGQHVMSVWFQYAAYRAQFDEKKLLATALARLSEFAPGLPNLVSQSQVLTARELETKFRLSEGHLYGGEMILDQSFYLRPVPGYAQYATPLGNFFLCGAATHPGGGISGLAGRNVVEELAVKNLALTV